MKKTTLCYIEKDNKYLMLYRNKKENDINKGKWIGIGGKFEMGETPTECMLREVKEETGLTPTDFKQRGIVNFYSQIHEDEQMHLFSIYEYSGEITQCDEGELKWIDKEELYNLTLWEGDGIFLKLISEKETGFFNLSLYYDNNDNLSEAKFI